MKRWSWVATIGLVAALVLSGCGKQSTSSDTLDWTIPALTAADLSSGAKLQVVATTSIVGDIVKNVGGDAIDLKVLLPVGTDPHAFNATPQDVAAVSDADVVMANGAGLEEFLVSLIQSAGDVPVVPLADGVTLHEGGGHEDEAAEGATPEAEEHEHAVDPHTWTTPTNALVYVQNAAAALGTLDPANAAIYTANAAAYTAQLQEVDGWIQSQIDTIPADNRKLVTDHEAFGYYCEQYGLAQVGAVIPAYTTEAGASAQDLANLEDTMRAQNVKAVFVSSSTNPTVADTLASDLGIQVVSLYVGSLGPDGSGAETYLGYLRYNTNAIVAALQ